MQELLKCPYCPCTFFHTSDLERHLKAFGEMKNKKTCKLQHKKDWQGFHYNIDEHYHYGNLE